MTKVKVIDEEGNEITYYDDPEELSEIVCPICGVLFDSEDEMHQHIQIWHEEVYEKLSKDAEVVSRILNEDKEVMESTKDRLMRETLEEIRETNPRHFEAIKLHPEILEKEVERKLWKMAFNNPVPERNLERSNLTQDIRRKEFDRFKQLITNTKMCPICRSFPEDVSVLAHMHEISEKDVNHERFLSYYLDLGKDLSELDETYYYPQGWSKYPKASAGGMCPEGYVCMFVHGIPRCIPLEIVTKFYDRYPQYKKQISGQTKRTYPMPKPSKTTKGFVETSRESLSESKEENPDYQLAKSFIKKKKED